MTTASGETRGNAVQQRNAETIGHWKSVARMNAIRAETYRKMYARQLEINGTLRERITKLQAESEEHHESR
ncbi:hypothetical protein EP30_02385 [Bifidobacterium sp. UTCIF-39]|uniref:hypothetical protein n=1 Tax=Bifidobacterium sp. UTCIF-39 TaxID=1465359 RepID=UPI0011287809|nr:hypothetical protein [Bifidobacterium sp. UTCIF-39]TPF97460.1 hypothetical protein EP30_02385 [Bifidobacterium sp. UTCIF-39]